MAKYPQRSCPKCNGHLGIVVPERKAELPVQPINGRCLKCGYRLAWVLVRGKNGSGTKPTTFQSSLDSWRHLVKLDDCARRRLT